MTQVDMLFTLKEQEQKIKLLEEQKSELLEGLARFTAWPKTYIECDKSGLHHARCHAEFLIHKYNPQNRQS